MKTETIQKQTTMYTTYSAGYAKFRFPYHVGTGKCGHKPGHQTVRTQKAPARRKPYGFLNRTLQPIAPDLYTETYRGRSKPDHRREF